MLCNPIIEAIPPSSVLLSSAGGAGKCLLACHVARHRTSPTATHLHRLAKASGLNAVKIMIIRFA